MSGLPAHDPYEALRDPDFRLLLAGNALSSLGAQMVTLGIGWEIYLRTNSALALGLVGLVQVVPVLLLALVAGPVADRDDRKRIVRWSQLVIVAGSLGLTALGTGPLAGIYACLLIIGVGQAFNNPAARTLPVEVVPEATVENSATWSSSINQLASVVGPALGGVLIAATGRTTAIYALNALAALVFVGLLQFVRGDHPAPHLRPRHPGGRPDRFRLAAGRPFGRRDVHGAIPGPPPALAAGRAHPAGGSRRLRAGHHRLRPLALLPALAADAVRARRPG